MTRPDGDDEPVPPPADPTVDLKLPPVPPRRPPVPPRQPAAAAPADAEPVPVAADQPTDQLPSPGPREDTSSFGPWQPLQPRVVPRRRNRTPYVVGALVLLIVVVGVVAVLVYGR